MNRSAAILVILILILCWTNRSTPLIAQGDDEYAGGLLVPLSEDGSKYFRILGWGQMWLQYKETQAQDASALGFSIRRARGLFYAQLNDRFLFLGHIGLNNLNSSELDPLGKGDGTQIFLHGLWGEYTIIPTKLHAGAGLHYWNGITRLNSQSTLNMLTLDNHRTSWATLGLSDQFARHLGVYIKGSLGRFAYRLSMNDALRKTLDQNMPLSSERAVYRGKELLGKDAQFAYAGYFEFHLLDKESTFLPYKVGTYLGSKQVLTLGAGFFSHPNGTVVTPSEGVDPDGTDVFHLGFDVFYEAPIRYEKGDAISFYLSYQNLDYGKHYFLNSQIGTGQIVYGHVGYLFPSLGALGKIQPYISYSWKDFEAKPDPYGFLGLGMNWYIQGHHAKISIEYRQNNDDPSGSNQSAIVQAMVYL